MATHDAELLTAARQLLERRKGLKGPLATARVRRSISTTYYALFHFMLDEVAQRVVGTTNDLRVRRRILARTISHKAAKTALDKVRGANVHESVEDFLRPRGGAAGAVPTPIFLRNLARTFIDAQAKRHDADYDLNTPLSERDADLLHKRVGQVIQTWQTAASPADKDAKAAVCILILLGGKLRVDS